MNERLEIFLNLSSATWDNLKGGVEHPVPVKVHVDCQGGVWDVKNWLAPCGGGAEVRSNPYRSYLFCQAHPEEGVLVLQYRDNSWYWLSGKEAKK